MPLASVPLLPLLSRFQVLIMFGDVGVLTCARFQGSNMLLSVPSYEQVRC